MRKRAGIGAIHKKKVDAEKFKYEAYFNFYQLIFFSFGFSLRREKRLVIYICIPHILCRPESPELNNLNYLAYIFPLCLPFELTLLFKSC